MTNTANENTIETAWCVDWISCTFRGAGITEKDVRRALNLGYPNKAWTDTQAHYGYTLGLQHPLGHIVYSNPMREEMGTHVMMGGRALRNMAEAGLPQDEILTWCLGHGGRISRLDLAIDVFGQQIDPIALGRCAQVKGAEGTARTQKSVENGQGGKTLYRGSRSSERSMRIYDKANEQALTDVLWTRLELELKGDSARQAAISLVGLPQAERAAWIKGLMRALYNPNDPTYQAIMDAPAVTLSLPTKDETDKTYAWVMNQVAKAVASLMIRRTDTDVWDEFVRAVHANVLAKGGTFGEDA